MAKMNGASCGNIKLCRCPEEAFTPKPGLLPGFLIGKNGTFHSVFLLFAGSGSSLVVTDDQLPHIASADRDTMSRSQK